MTLSRPGTALEGTLYCPVHLHTSIWKEFYTLKRVPQPLLLKSAMIALRYITEKQKGKNVLDKKKSTAVIVKNFITMLKIKTLAIRKKNQINLNHQK